MAEPTQYTGLTAEEVKSNREQYGMNTLETEDQNRFWQVLREVATEPLFVILVLTGLIYFLLGKFSEGMIMLVALSFVSGISLFQEHRSRNAVDTLNKLASPLAKVIRDGNAIEIPSEEIVMNDLIIVEDGNLVPADAIILRMNDFSINESILTGEALPVLKDLASENNSIFKGTLVMTGSCTARVNAIGKNTAFGKIGQSLSEINVSKTPLQIQIKSFIRSMVSLGVIAFIIVWAANYYLTRDVLHGLLHGLTLAMSVLPEEIPVAFSTFMALGAYHLYKRKVIARSPHTVETLGAATVICVDKTGTITENEMQLAVIYDFNTDKFFDYTKNSASFNEVLEYALWASETHPFDAMEKAIHQAYEKAAPNDQRKEYTMLREYPLSGKPPVMTHVFSNSKGEHLIACKGGVEGILNQCLITAEQKAEVQDKTKNLASKGYRVLGVARSFLALDRLPDSQHDFEFDFLGLVAFYDPPKENMADILQTFYTAGIQVKMITGDYAETAVAIADQINFRKGSHSLSGDEIMKMQDLELLEKVRETNIYARMFPDAKLRVIEALKSNNEVVAMTGDGVNDAPALKAAHIGIAMGMRGSEVAKNAASLILMDDDLFHMTEAVALGRRIYENLKKAIQYIISIHIPIILIVTLPLVLFWKFQDIFSPIHVIILELIMGPTCSIIYENEPMEANFMEKAPRKMNTSFFSFRELSMSILQGLVITAACLGIGYYYMANGSNETLVRTVIYTTLIFSNLFLTLANRSFLYSIFTTLRYKNRLIPIILAISLVVLFISIYLPPVQRIFRFEALGGSDLLYCLIPAFIGVMWVEIFKWLKRKRKTFNKPERS